MGLIRKKILTNMIMYQHTYTVTLYKLTAKRVSSLKWSPCMGDLGFPFGGGAKGGKGEQRGAKGGTDRWLLCIALVQLGIVRTTRSRTSDHN